MPTPSRPLMVLCEYPIGFGLLCACSRSCSRSQDHVFWPCHPQMQHHQDIQQNFFAWLRICAHACALRQLYAAGMIEPARRSCRARGMHVGTLTSGASCSPHHPSDCGRLFRQLAAQPPTTCNLSDDRLCLLCPSVSACSHLRC